MNIKILRQIDQDALIRFEKNKLKNLGLGEIEAEFESWNASWREESLRHYLELGWSFACWEGEEGQSDLKGYFLAQPLLFFEQLTQTLWVEHLSALEPKVAEALLDVAYRLGREKHMQKLLVRGKSEQREIFLQNNFFEREKGIFERLTAKIKSTC